MLITSLAGSTSSVFANPFWLLNTRMTLAKEKKTILQTVKEIYDKDGISEFYKGVLPNMILVLNPIINFVVYEAIKKFLTLKGEKGASMLKIFIASSVGKILATFATYPILTVRVKLQKAAESGEAHEGQWKMFRRIMDELNFSDFFTGIQAKIVQTVLYNAFLLIAYEKIRLAVKYIVLRYVLKRRSMLKA